MGPGSGLLTGPLRGRGGRLLLLHVAGPVFRIGGDLAVAVANYPADDKTDHRGEAHPASSHDEDQVQRGDDRCSFRFSYP